MFSRILVTGASGQVGSQLVRALEPLGDVVAPTRAELDLSSDASIRRCIRALQPRWIVNAAAYTAVDQAESEPALAHAINAEAPGIIGEEAEAIDAPVIHFSTDYVFDGTNATPYLETDPTAPLNVYGASKLAGESALRQSCRGSLIFRTSWVYGATGKNFLRTFLKLAHERDQLRIVADQHGAPTWSRDLASLIAHVIAQIEHEAATEPVRLIYAARYHRGIYHAAGSGETTWAGFATEALRQLAERDPSINLATIIPITTAEYPTPAARPLNSRLDCSKLDRTFNYNMMDWHNSLHQVLDELA